MEQLSTNSTKQQSQCPYLNTIKRYLLDFDFEKNCSISLSRNNIFGCLVCGKYFLGKGPKTPAYEHSIQYAHYMFISLHTGSIFCIPDNYEVNTNKLDDIKYNLNPTYNKSDLTSEKLFKLEPSYNIDGREYIPGIIGYNNLGQTDYANTVFQILNIIPQFRETMLLNTIWKDELLDKMSLFCRKVWNNKNFKGIISPHQLIQSISQKSNKTFKIGKINDPSIFFVWLINNLDKLLQKQKKISKFSLMNLFQGQVKTSFIRGIKDSAQYQRVPQKVQAKKFIILKIQFPQKGIFNKTKNQTLLSEMMLKYSGSKGTPAGDGLYFTKIINFPQYLVLVFKRFTKTEYKIQKDSSEVVYNGHIQLDGHKYRLQGQICHEGQYQGGHFYAHIFMGQRWFITQDLKVKEVNKKDVLLGQPMMQMYKMIK